MNRPTKIGFVGCGFMGQLVHLPNFVASERCEVVALAELRPELGRIVADKYGIPKVYTHSSELAQDGEVSGMPKPRESCTAYAGLTSGQVSGILFLDLNPFPCYN